MLICVIGAGAAGLTSIKQCLDQKLEVICYEKTDDIGGLWRLREENIEDVGSVSEYTVMKSSKEMSAFSNFVPPENFPTFMPHQIVCSYLEHYAKHFNLMPYIRFNNTILNVTFNDDYDETGNWRVTIHDHKKNETFEQVFNGVIVCVGHHSKPRIPTFHGQQTFEGNIVHTRNLISTQQYNNKVAVVVGIGNSGVEAAVELSSTCSQVYLVARSDRWIFYLTKNKGIPIDFYCSRALNQILALIPKKIAEYIYKFYAFKLIIDNCNKHYSPDRILTQYPTADDRIEALLKNGKILIRRIIKHFTKSGVVFEGFEDEIKCDVVILATGYELNLPFMDAEIMRTAIHKTKLFKNTFLPNLKHAHTLAMLNFIHPWGSILPINEMQARWFALLIAGKRKLPSQLEMIRCIESKSTNFEIVDNKSHRDRYIVKYIDYMDEIASYIGCRPNLLKYFFTDFNLWRCLMFGPAFPYHYRLEGPNQWDGARVAILNHTRRFNISIRN